MLDENRKLLMTATLPHPGADTRGQLPSAGSDQSAVPGLLPVRFSGPPAAPGVRFSAHRALHVSCPLVSR